jgi:hypothetical protein
VSGISSGSTTLNDTTLVVTGKMTGGSVTGNASTVDILGQMTGGSVTLNSSMLMVGSNSSMTPSVTGGSITYGTGVDSVVLANIASGNNNVSLVNLNDGDSIAESNIPFTSATFSGNEVILKNGATTVATFTKVTLAAGAQQTFQTVMTENIGGTIFYVATLDPPIGATGATGASGVAGVTGAIGPTDATGARGDPPTGSSDPLTTPIDPDNVVSGLDKMKFLHGMLEGGAGGISGSPDGLGKLGLAKVLATDLTNLGSVVKAWRHDDSHLGLGFDRPPTGHPVGISNALSNLDNTGKPDPLLTHDTIKPHH